MSGGSDSELLVYPQIPSQRDFNFWKDEKDKLSTKYLMKQKNFPRPDHQLCYNTKLFPIREKAFGLIFLLRFPHIF